MPSRQKRKLKMTNKLLNLNNLNTQLINNQVQLLKVKVVYFQQVKAVKDQVYYPPKLTRLCKNQANFM